jgi:hypothetical protein
MPHSGCFASLPMNTQIVEDELLPFVDKLVAIPKKWAVDINMERRI